MVKFIFLAIMLVNIVFFLWQLRIGAPGIYLPPNYEKRIAHSAGRQKIILLSEMPELSLGGCPRSALLNMRYNTPPP